MEHEDDYIYIYIYIITRRRLGPRHRDLRVERRPQAFELLLEGLDGHLIGRRHDALEQEEGSRLPVLARDPDGVCGQFVDIETRRSQDFGYLVHDARSIVARAPYSGFSHRTWMARGLDLARRDVQS